MTLWNEREALLICLETKGNSYRVYRIKRFVLMFRRYRRKFFSAADEKVFKLFSKLSLVVSILSAAWFEEV